MTLTTKFSATRPRDLARSARGRAQLPQVASASGEKYQDGPITFWRKGSRAVSGTHTGTASRLPAGERLIGRLRTCLDASTAPYSGAACRSAIAIGCARIARHLRKASSRQSCLRALDAGLRSLRRSLHHDVSSSGRAARHRLTITRESSSARQAAVPGRRTLIQLALLGGTAVTDFDRACGMTMVHASARPPYPAARALAPVADPPPRTASAS